MLDEIKELTKSHFKNITDTNLNTRDPDIHKFWNETYEPIENINIEWYKDLMIEINEDEWTDTVKDLPSEKASGISMISYDIIKHIGKEAKKVLIKFYNEIIKNSFMPSAWLKAVIYPIPKLGDWNLDINKTRPITLLECPRKLLMKIITNRLTKILATHKEILGEHNFAALSGKSMNEPIYLTNNIMEDARKNKKEL